MHKASDLGFCASSPTFAHHSTAFPQVAVDDARPMTSSPPLVLAHRGARRVAPENTLDAFALAIAMGADGVELDVRRTADGALVLHHDPAVLGGDLIAATTEAA